MEIYTEKNATTNKICLEADLFAYKQQMFRFLSQTGNIFEYK